jgi:hypothetical protein
MITSQSGFNPPALWLVAVGAVVGTGAGDVLAQPKAMVLQEGMKPEVEAVAAVDGVEPGLEGFSQLVVAGL